MKYYLISGEASGDLHGANLMKSLKNLDAGAEFRVWGGDRMKNEGGVLVKHYRELAFMGFIEVIFNLRTVLKNISFCKKDLLCHKPDVLILIDYPGFNLRIAEFAHQQGIKVAYYISPQIWAWKKSRVHLIKRVVDRMLVILPFEADFYNKYNFKVDFVGHPLLDAIHNEPIIDKETFFTKHGLPDKPVIALLPGSRKQEVGNMLSEMLKVIPFYPDHQFVIAGVDNLPDDAYASFTGDKKVTVVFNETHHLLRTAQAALVTSGTATLETALLGVPEVVCYKGNSLSYQIARRVVDVKYISLVNLILDREVVKELIQNELNTQNLRKQLDLLLFDHAYRSKLRVDYIELVSKLGSLGASDRAANLIVSMLKPA
jgi:lipid-A-disaccharide synthase